MLDPKRVVNKWIHNIDWRGVPKILEPLWHHPCLYMQTALQKLNAQNWISPQELSISWLHVSRGHMMQNCKRKFQLIFESLVQLTCKLDSARIAASNGHIAQDTSTFLHVKFEDCLIYTERIISRKKYSLWISSIESGLSIMSFL